MAPRKLSIPPPALSKRRTQRPEFKPKVAIEAISRRSVSARRSRRSLWITPVLSNQRLPPTLESRWPIAQVCSPPADGNAQVPSPDCPGLLHRRTGRGPDPGRTGDWRCRTLQLGESAGLLIRPAEGDPLGRTCGFGDKPMWLIQQCFSLPPAGLPSGNQAER